MEKKRKRKEKIPSRFTHECARFESLSWCE
jgi:hypothetical protein